MVAPKKKRLGWAPLAALIGLLVGGALGSATNDTTARITDGNGDSHLHRTATTKTAEEPSPKPTKSTKLTPKKQEPKRASRRASKRQVGKDREEARELQGDRYIIYGQVTQFDSATGDDSFLADTAHRNTMSYGFFDGENTLLTALRSSSTT
jgi:hypothetical protein